MDSPPSKSIAVLDYGMGNLRSVEKALERVGLGVRVTRDPDQVRAADGVVLPGVGAFPMAMSRIRRLGLDELIRERASAGVPILGICLGFQLLLESSAELGGAEGLGLIAGTVTALEAPGLKIPNIGWSHIRWERHSRLGDGLEDGTAFYFVHSYACRPEPGDLLATAEYGERFACMVERENVFGVQFHPEKSSTAGLRLLANFGQICAAGAPA